MMVPLLAKLKYQIFPKKAFFFNKKLKIFFDFFLSIDRRRRRRRKQLCDSTAENTQNGVKTIQNGRKTT